MPRRRVMGITMVLMLLLATQQGWADPAPSGFLHIETPSHIVTDGGTDLRLPPGWFLDEPNWGAREAELKRLQDQETRLNAENRSLRGTVSSWQPGWVTVLSVVVVGVAGGWYLRSQL